MGQPQAGVTLPVSTELHCHLDNILDAALVSDLRARGLDAGVDADALAACCPSRSKADWLDRYVPLTAPAHARADVMSGILAAHARRLAAQGITYAEIMVAGMLGFEQDDGRLADLLDRMRRDAQDAAGGAVQLELLIAIGRAAPARVDAKARRAEGLFRAGAIRGVALAGDEAACSVQSCRATFARLHDAGLGIEIHAGEWCGPESVRDALDHGFPDRIGHGVRAFQDPALVDRLAASGVHLEMCPTSNLITGAVATLDAMPVRQALDRGVRFSISTDDPAPFDCSMTSEVSLVTERFGVTPAEWARIEADARRARFADRAPR